MDAVHVEMPHALHAAAAAAGVARIVLISAISARDDVDTDYSRSKLAGERALRGSGVAWTILRPSLVYGDGSYGGTSLLRGMAALPWCVPLPGAGDFAFTPSTYAILRRRCVGALVVCARLARIPGADRRVLADDRQAAALVKALSPAAPDSACRRPCVRRRSRSGWRGRGCRRARFACRAPGPGDRRRLRRSR
jgi:hypothetical protein